MLTKQNEEMFDKWYFTNIICAVLLFMLIPASLIAEKGTAFYALLIGVFSTLWVIAQLKTTHYFSDTLVIQEKYSQKLIDENHNYRKQVEPGVAILDRLDKISYKLLTADQLISVNNEHSARLNLLLDKLEADTFGEKPIQTPGIVAINETAETNPAPQ